MCTNSKKIKFLHFLFLLIFLKTNCFSQQDSTKSIYLKTETLPEIQIISKRENLHTIPLLSIHGIRLSEISSTSSKIELIENLPGIDIRQRGSNGVQGDVQYRGGSAEQCMILLNLIPMNDVQTGHHNLNLPIPDIAIAKANVYSATESFSNFQGAYNGIISFSSIQTENNQVSFHISTGSFNQLKGELLLALKHKKTLQTIAYSQEKSDAYTFNNDFNAKKFFYSFNLTSKANNILKFETGFIEKNFGAHSFYSNKFPTQFESIKNGFASLSLQTSGKISVQPIIFWKKSYDRFELFRESLYEKTDNFYIWGTDTAKLANNIFYTGHNYHLSDIIGTSLSLHQNLGFGELKLGMSYTYDLINSTVLGDPINKPIINPFAKSIFFDHSASRNTNYIFAKFIVKKINNVHFNALSNLLILQNKVVPGWGFNFFYSPTSLYSIWISSSKSYRLPTYTELYYSSPTNIGNNHLNAEISYNNELGISINFNNLEFRNNIFIISGLNTIDWLKKANENIYYAMNHTHLTTIGNTFSIVSIPKQNTFFRKYLKQMLISYTYISKNKASGNLISAYSLDYLKHKIASIFDIKIYKNYGTNIEFAYMDRNEGYTYNINEIQYMPWSNLDISIYYNNQTQYIYLAAHNIFNIKQIDFGGIQLPNRWFNLGIKVNIAAKSNS